MPYIYALDIEMLKIKENTFILGLSHTSFSHEIYNWDKYEYIHMYNTWFGKVGTVKLSKATDSVSIVTSVTQSCPPLCDPMKHSTPGLPVHHQPPEFTQLMSTESVMPSSHLILCCPLLLLPPIPPSIRVFSMSQLFTWDGRSTGVSVSASVLPMNTQDWSPLGWTGWSSLQSKGLSRVFSNTIVQKHQFFGAQLSSRRSNWSNHWSLLINKSTALLPSQPSNHILVFLATTSQCCLGMSHCFRVLTKSLLTPTSMPKTFWQFWFLLQRLGFPSR